MSSNALKSMRNGSVFEPFEACRLCSGAGTSCADSGAASGTRSSGDEDSTTVSGACAVRRSTAGSSGAGSAGAGAGFGRGSATPPFRRRLWKPSRPRTSRKPFSGSKR